MYDTINFLTDTLKTGTAVTSIEIADKLIPENTNLSGVDVKAVTQVVICSFYIFNFFKPFFNNKNKKLTK